MIAERFIESGRYLVRLGHAATASEGARLAIRRNNESLLEDGVLYGDAARRALCCSDCGSQGISTAARDVRESTPWNGSVRTYEPVPGTERFGCDAHPALSRSFRLQVSEEDQWLWDSE